MNSFDRIVALALTLLLSGGNALVCGGWAATPEARMACCTDAGDCPMHGGDSDGGRSSTAISQAQADACCAASERDRSSQPNPAAVMAISNAVLGPGVIVPADVATLVRSDAWRTHTPLPVTPVPRHLLLSVFLV